jgi:hypothetical protein
VIGKYRGEFGEQTITGTRDDNAVKLRIAASGIASTISVVYQGELDASGEISGVLVRNVSRKVTRGKWTATPRNH